MGLPWERPEVSAWQAIVETTKLVLLRPQEAFQRMSLTVTVWRPLTYALVLGSIGLVFTALYDLVFGQAIREMMRQFSDVESGREFPRVVGAGIQIVFAPLWAACAVLLGAAVNHLCLMIFGASSRGFGATFRVACYSMAPMIFDVVPFCGTLVAGIWSLVILVIGYAEVHRTTRTRTALAVILPAVLCCACVIFAMISAFSIFKHFQPH